jgi:hypothetical protein
MSYNLERREYIPKEGGAASNGVGGGGLAFHDRLGWVGEQEGGCGVDDGRGSCCAEGLEAPKFPTRQDSL